MAPLSVCAGVRTSAHYARVTVEESLDEEDIRVCGDVGDVGWLC